MVYTIWATIALTCFIIEAMFPGIFIFLPLALACSITAITSTFFQSLTMNIITLFVSLTTILFAFRVWSRQTDTQHLTNVYGVIGQKGYVISPISPYKKGYVHIDHGTWLATAQTYLANGTRVEVQDVRGCHVIVHKCPTDKGF